MFFWLTQASNNPGGACTPFFQPQRNGADIAALPAWRIRPADPCPLRGRLGINHRLVVFLVISSTCWGGNNHPAITARSRRKQQCFRASDAKSPAGADIRYMMDNKWGNMIQQHGSTHRHPGNVHARVSEFWYVLEGCGDIWRVDAQKAHVDHVPGTTIVSRRNNLSVPQRIRWRSEIHLHRHAALAG